MNKKKITGVVVAVTAVALIGASAVYMLNNNDVTVEQSEQAPVESITEVLTDERLPEPEKDNSIIEKVEVAEDGSVTAIVNGEAFVGEATDKGDKTLEENVLDLGAELGLSEEEIAEVLGSDIPSISDNTESTQNTDKTDTSETDTNDKNNETVQTNNEDQPDEQKPTQNEQTPSVDNNDNNQESDNEQGKNEDKQYDENGYEIWTPPEGFVPIGQIINGDDTIRGVGDGTVPEEDKDIKFK